MTWMGNTPAYAGKTFLVSLTISKVMETPPLTRGRHYLVPTVSGTNGNTPAYAGKTATFCTKTNLTIQNTLLLTDLSVFH